MTEEQKYVVEKTFPKFEIRRYEPCVLADVQVSTNFQSAGNVAFGSLIGYISGRNDPSMKIAMTAPVLQESSNGSNIVSFVMPAGASIDSMPVPTNSRVTLRTIPEGLVAVSRFSGRWTESSFQKQLAKLETHLDANGYIQTGNPRFARFDPPWTPWFVRRNEIQIPIEKPTQ